MTPPNSLVRYFKASLGYRGFSKTVLLNILLAGFCEAGHIDVATFYLEVSKAKWDVQPNEIRSGPLRGPSRHLTGCGTEGALPRGV